MSETKRGGFWTVKELAVASGLTPARIRQLLIAGRELRGEKVGRDWMIRDAEARRWLAERETLV